MSEDEDRKPSTPLFGGQTERLPKLAGVKFVLVRPSRFVAGVDSSAGPGISNGPLVAGSSVGVGFGVSTGGPAARSRQTTAKAPVLKQICNTP